MRPLRWEAGDATVARLEVHGAGGDPIATRQRIEALLGALELRAGALPPSAILCVRELRDPLPGKLSLTSRQLRPPAEWEQALQREVDRLASSAAWPERGAVAPAAEAVVFAEEAELLACLGSDLVTGALSGRWWWRLLVRGIEDPRPAVVGAWRSSVESAPAALERLAARGEAARFVRALEDADVRALATAIAERFALPVLAAVPGGRPASAAVMSASPRSSFDNAAGREVPSPPWRALTAGVDEAGLPPDRRELLGIVLTLVRAPAYARSAAFAAQMAAWREAVETPPFAAPAAAVAPKADPKPPFAAPLSPQARSPATAARVDAFDAADAAPTSAPGDPRAASAAPAEGTATTVKAPPAQTSVDVAGPRTLTEAAPSVENAPAFAPGEARAADSTSQPAPTSRPPPPPTKLLSLRPRTRDFGPAIDTGLGGLFYLVNLALYLRLYGDEENLPLPLWDFVELVGRRLLEDPGADGDAVWPLLAALSGRVEGDPAGAGFAPPPDFLLPARSLDLPDHPDLAVLATPPPTLPEDPLERWLYRFVPYLRARLRLALALPADEGLPAVLLRHRARVHLTDTHLDVVCSLETLPVSIRLAGLDRDPGWVAAAGRFIAFHFE